MKYIFGRPLLRLKVGEPVFAIKAMRFRSSGATIPKWTLGSIADIDTSATPTWIDVNYPGFGRYRLFAEQFDVEYNGKVVASRMLPPVISAWYVTFFMMQGKTISSLLVNFDGVWRHANLIHSAVSRVDKLAHLYVRGYKVGQVASSVCPESLQFVKDVYRHHNLPDPTAFD